MSKSDNVSTQILSDITVYMKYARYVPEKKRRETWDEIIDRNIAMHTRRYPGLVLEIQKAFQLVKEKKVLPSMRSMQFAGKPIELSPNRIYNCAYLPIDDVHAFSETMFLLLGGTGVGYSVQKQHVAKLPTLKKPITTDERGKPIKKRRFLIGDSIEGWADTIKALLNSYFRGNREIEFDYRDIRPKGAKLVTSGGKAPGPQPLKDCVHNIRKVLNTAIEERGERTKLTTLEVHDIMCHIADAVLAGGIRRAAMISLFSFDDEDMMTCKFGDWWELNPQRGRANNSAVALRSEVTKEDFNRLWERVQASGSGEPGIYFTNDLEWGTNPCVEIGLKPFQFCNLTTTNASDVESQQDLNERVKAAAFIGTLQASYTDFHYLREVWQETTEEDALIGVSMTGIGSNAVANLNLEEAANVVKTENERVAKLLGINPAARTTAIKPEGCLVKESMISTSKGILSLEEIGDVEGSTWQEHNLKVNTDKEARESTKFYVNGFKETKRIILDSGIELESTHNHKFRVITDDGEYIWKRADEIEEGDLLPYSVGEYNGGEYQQLNQVEFKYSPYASRRVAINQPEILNEDFAWLLGLYFGDGTNKDRSIRIYGNVDEQKGFDKATKIIKEQFGLESLLKKRVSDNPDEKRCHLQINSKELLGFLAVNNLLKQKSYEIEIPLAIRMSPKSVIQAFIDGYQTADGRDRGNNISFSTVSENFARQLVVVLRAIGHDAKLRRVSRKAMRSDTKHKGDRDSFLVSIRKGRLNENKNVLKKSIRDVWSKLDKLGMPHLSADQVIDVYDSKNYTYDLEINHDEHTYLANSYVSHNTSSLTLGVSSGIHAWHNDYYLRRIRVGKNESIYSYLSIMHPELVEDEFFRPDTQAVITVPQKAPEGAILRNESATELLTRMKKFSTEWVRPGHKDGVNTHNVSVTVSIKEHEWDTVGEWMWENRDIYNGISVLPYDGGTYTQAPFEDCTKEEYEERLSHLVKVDLTKVIEDDDNTDLSGEIACGGSSSCEVK